MTALSSPVHIIDAEIRAKEFPKTFLIPSRTVRRNLKIGDWAKLIFDGRERLWVVIVDLRKIPFKPKYVGKLVTPPMETALKVSDVVFFSPRHVASVDSPKEGDLK